MRKILQKKLTGGRGETLVELLAAILIGSMSVTLLAFGVTAAGNMERTARLADEGFYRGLTAAEGQAVPTAENRTVLVGQGGSTVTLPVDVYGDEGLYSYRLAGGDPP